jgi:hypothetical protein
MIICKFYVSSMLFVFLLELVLELHPDLSLLTVHEQFVHLVHLFFKHVDRVLESRHLFCLDTL